MKIAVSAYNERISPVFDVSKQVILLEIRDGAVISTSTETLNDDLEIKITQIACSGIKVLLCGAISKPAAGMLMMRDIQVIPFVTGEFAAVVKAYISGNLMSPQFFMPGCYGQGREISYGLAGTFITGRRHGWSGQHQGPGYGPGGVPGRKAGPFGLCLCPQCGHEIRHERGMPCVERKCPKCGTTMIRKKIFHKEA